MTWPLVDGGERPFYRAVSLNGMHDARLPLVTVVAAALEFCGRVCVCVCVCVVVCVFVSV